MCSKNWIKVFEASCGGAKGESIGVADSMCLAKDQPRSWWRLWKQGPERQAASGCCCGGVSAVISVFNFDEHTSNQP